MSDEPRKYYAEKEEEEEKKSVTWLISFTDIMGLMLTFFVLLFSMSHPKESAWTDVIASLGNEFKTAYGGKGMAGENASEEISRMVIDNGLNLDYLHSILHTIFQKNDQLKGVTLKQGPDFISLSFPSDILFEPGQATLTPKAEEALSQFVSILKGVKNTIEIQGHADPTPMRSITYPSNWALSISRANAVAGYFYNEGYKRDIIVRGEGAKIEWAFTGEETEELDFSEFRRVDLIIRSYKGLSNSFF